MALALACGGGGAAGQGLPAAPIEPAPYLVLESGDLPLVLSAPHGGTLELPGVPVRTRGTTVLDTNTRELAQAIQARLYSRTGRKAHLVAALASRKFVDFNRNAADAYETATVAPLYEAYHHALAVATAAARSQAPTGALLVDLHGQGDTSSVVYRGTRDGRTALLPALYSVPGGFLSGLLGRGIRVEPATAGGTENPNFNGGTIVATYGLLTPPGLPALQLEFGMDFRQSAQLQDTASAVVEALVAHLQATAPGILPSRRSEHLWGGCTPPAPPLPSR